MNASKITEFIIQDLAFSPLCNKTGSIEFTANAYLSCQTQMVL